MAVVTVEITKPCGDYAAADDVNGDDNNDVDDAAGLSSIGKNESSNQIFLHLVSVFGGKKSI